MYICDIHNKYLYIIRDIFISRVSLCLCVSHSRVSLCAYLSNHYLQVIVYFKTTTLYQARTSIY